MGGYDANHGGEGQLMSKNAFIFPGQGAQTLKMGLDFFESFPEAREIFESADEILKRHLSKLIFGGDPQELTLTKNSQPAIYVTSMAILRVLQKQFSDLKPSVTGGLSLGEYSALAASEKASYEDVLKLVAARGEFMHQAAKNHPGTMAAVIGLEEKTVTQAGFFVANVNCPGQVVIAGEVQEIEKAMVELKEIGARRVIKLDVSGAFHSKLMDEAKENMRPLIEETQIRPTDIRLVMNVTGTFCDEPRQIKENLVAQVSHMTRWLDCVNEMENCGIDFYFEMGPAQLGGMNKKIGVKAQTVSIQTVRDLEKVYESIRK